MIFSEQKLDQAFSYVSKYFDKVLKINLETDKCTPIKVNESEWESHDKDLTFTQWVDKFTRSNIYRECQSSEVKLNYFSRLENLVNITNIRGCRYQKLINDEWHDVLLEFVPAEKGRAFIFVKDWTLMERGTNDEE